MPKPNIVLHIHTSLDGRITGDYGRLSEVNKSSEIFNALGFNDEVEEGYKFQGWLYGTNTSQWFTGGAEPELIEGEEVPEGDYVINQGQDKYYIALDRRGVLGWPTATASYGGQTAHVIEVLTSLASPSYKAFLRRRGIPYIIAGQETIDLDLMLSKLQNDYQLDQLLLGGGGILNWSFLKEGLIDEVSLVVAPAVDGREDTARLFSSEFADNPEPIAFELVDVKALEGSTIWVRYRPLNTRHELKLEKE